MPGCRRLKRELKRRERRKTDPLGKHLALLSAPAAGRRDGRAADISDGLGCLLVVVTGVVWAALRHWPLNICTDCFLPV